MHSYTTNLSAKSNVHVPWLHKDLTKAMCASISTHERISLIDYKRKHNCKVANCNNTIIAIPGLLNDFFSGPVFNHSYLLYLQQTTTTSLIPVQMSVSVRVSMAHLITDDEVLEILLSMDTTKSNGSDGISATMAKATATSMITPGITKLMDQSISPGEFP